MAKPKKKAKDDDDMLGAAPEEKHGKIGHNSGEDEPEDEDDEDGEPKKGVATNVSGKRLTSFLERIERLEEEKKALAEDIRDVYSEAKSIGFETKIMRKMIALRKTNVEKRREEQELLELYMSAIGMAE